jgi:hypothetical protein
MYLIAASRLLISKSRVAAARRLRRSLNDFSKEAIAVCRLARGECQPVNLRFSANKTLPRKGDAA